MVLTNLYTSENPGFLGQILQVLALFSWRFQTLFCKISIQINSADTKYQHHCRPSDVCLHHLSTATAALSKVIDLVYNPRCWRTLIFNLSYCVYFSIHCL